MHKSFCFRSLIGLFSLSIFCSCATRKAITNSFNKTFFKDTSFFKLKLPLAAYKESYYVYDSLVNAGYLYFEGYNEMAGGATALYSVAPKGNKFLVQTFYDSIDKKWVAEFLYYRLVDVRLTKYHFLNEKKDSLEASFKSNYIVKPMFYLTNNPKYTRAIFVKKNNDWVLVNPVDAIRNIYFVETNRWMHYRSYSNEFYQKLKTIVEKAK